MDKRYTVFVSSTYRDLKEERREVMQALLELDCIPVGMELFPAADDDAWSYIRKVIDYCDYYVVVIGGRYGSTDAEGISFTEKEYDYAVDQGIPVIAFLHGAVGEIPGEMSEMDPDARQKLDQFRAKAEERLCKQWRTPPELGGVVSRSLIKLIKQRPAVGWVRTHQAQTEENLSKMIALGERIKELESEVESLSAQATAEQNAVTCLQGRFSVSLWYDQDAAAETFKEDVIRGEVFEELVPKFLIRGRCEHQTIRKAIEEFLDDRLVGIHVSNSELDKMVAYFVTLGLIQDDACQGMWTLTELGKQTYREWLQVNRVQDKE